MGCTYLEGGRIVVDVSDIHRDFGLCGQGGVAMVTGFQSHLVGNFLEFD